MPRGPGRKVSSDNELLLRSTCKKFRKLSQVSEFKQTMPPRSSHDLNSFPWNSMQVRLIAPPLIAVVVFVISYKLESDMRLLLAYDLAISAYLALLVTGILNTDGQGTRDQAEKRESNNNLVLTLAGLLSGCSLAGVAIMLHRSRQLSPLMANFHLGLSLVAVFLSWGLLHVLFGIHYAHMYYDPTPPADEPADRKPLEFPQNELPDFWDFMYFSFTLAICYQVSDVTIFSRHLRRVALAHVLLSFVNVTIILGLVVEIVSTLTSSGGQVRAP